MNTPVNLHIHPLPELSKAVASFISQLSREAIEMHNHFTIALSGGSLPKTLFPALISEPFYTQINWQKWRVFWTDERCVPQTSPDSNYYLAREYLFRHVNIPPTQIYTPDTSLKPSGAADAYQATLRQIFKPAPEQLPRFDLVLLGMGEDGHTASLFPHHPILRETERWVASISDSPKPPPERITLTLPVINNARHVAFIITGASKSAIVQHILEKPHTDRPLPAHMVNPANGTLHWFIDESASARLKRNRLH
jgi:6-phosphogluconolactonase